MEAVNDPINIPLPVFDEHGDLEIKASPTSTENDFDFYVGSWKIHHKKLTARLSNCAQWIEFESTATMYKVLHGLGNIDHIYATVNGNTFEGMSVRFFNPHSKLWRIHWADTNNLMLDKPTVGSFHNHFGYFFSQDTQDGKKILIVYRWDIRNKEKPVWSQAFSADNGKNWEWNWYMYFSRTEA